MSATKQVTILNVHVALVVLIVGICLAATGVAQAADDQDPFAPLRGDPRDAPSADNISAAVEQVLTFDAQGERTESTYRIAYLTECVTNVYCQARLEGLQDAAEKYGFSFQVFDPNFNPSKQLRHVKTAIQGEFDGYLFAPTADAAGCEMWKNHLVPTGTPVVTLDLTMCGDVDYTEGVSGTVTMQRQPYFDLHWENALLSACEEEETCKGVSLSGHAGSDLFKKWNNAIDNAKAKHPSLDVEVVSRREAKFDPRYAREIVTDALTAHKDLEFIVSHDDAMTLGAAAAVKKAGLSPGEDVRIYSMGADSRGISKIKQGAFNESTALLPYEESYYAAVALVMALEGEPVEGYLNEAHLPPVTRAGSVLITSENVDRFYTPKW